MSKQGNTRTADPSSNWSALTLSHNVWLHVSIVILAGPNKSSRRLQDLSHHVVNEPVLVPDLQLVELWLVLPEKQNNGNILRLLNGDCSIHNQVWILIGVLLLKDVLEDVFEAPVVGLEDGVLGAHVQRPLLLDGILEAAVSKPTDGLCKENIITRWDRTVNQIIFPIWLPMNMKTWTLK